MKRILAVDGNSILNRAFYGIRVLTNSKGLPTNALTGFMNMIKRQLDAYSPDGVVVAFDRSAPTFRHKMYDGYKANRKGMPEELAVQLPYAKELCALMGFTVIEKDGIEADDILGTVSKKANACGIECYIFTGDRDSLQLIGDGTFVLLAVKNDVVLYDRDRFFADYRTEPVGLIDIKALMGDSSDCIPGVKGIGEKTAVALIEKYGNIDAVYADTDGLSVGASAKEKIVAGKDSAYMSKTLATIVRDTDIEFDLEKNSSPDKDALEKKLTQLEMFGVLRSLTSSDYFKSHTEGAKVSIEETETAHTAREIGKEEACAVLSSCCGCSIDHADAVLYCFDGENLYKTAFSGADELAAFIYEHISGLCVFDSKALYRFIYSHGYEPKLCAGDMMLAAYVVNSGMQKYTLDRIAGTYLHIADVKTDIGSEAVYVYKLKPVLEELLIASEQYELYEKIELPLAKVIADMELCGFYADKDGLAEFGKAIEAETATLEESIYTMTGEHFNINSPKQLGTVLFEKMKIPCTKKTKSGYSTDADTLTQIAPYYPVVDRILEYRTLTKLKSTFVDAMVKVICDDGRIHTSFNQATTATGRLSSAEPNMQNIPVRTKLGRELRKYFKAKDGCVLIDADYSQIELRLLAEISEDADFRNAFISGEDIHRMTASQVFDVPYELVSAELRSKAKAVNFGIIYGISPFSLAKDIGTSVSDAKRYIENYLSKYAGVRTYLSDVVKKAYDCGYVCTIFGRRRYVPELHSGKFTERKFGERVAMNSPIQGTAADIIKKAMVEVHEKLGNYPGAKLILQVHDELIIEAPEAIADAVGEMLKTEMESVFKSEVPLTVEVGKGDSWYNAK